MASNTTIDNCPSSTSMGIMIAIGIFITYVSAGACAQLVIKRKYLNRIYGKACIMTCAFVWIVFIVLVVVGIVQCG